MTSAKRAILKDYLVLFGSEDNVFDLTQYPDRRPRSLLKHGELPAVTKSCRLYSSRHGHCLRGVEALVAQAWPLDPSAAAYREELDTHFSSLPASLVFSFAGNGMHLGCLGAIFGWIFLTRYDFEAWIILWVAAQRL